MLEMRQKLQKLSERRVCRKRTEASRGYLETRLRFGRISLSSHLRLDVRRLRNVNTDLVYKRGQITVSSMILATLRKSGLSKLKH